MYSNNRGIFSMLLFFLILLANFRANAQLTIFHIQNYFSEAYLVKGISEKLILIETGVPVPGYQDSLVNSIRKLGFKPENIALAIVTHGHGDHAGNARFLQETYRIPIAGSKADLDKFTSGKTELAKCEDVSIWGNRLRPYSDLSYQPFTPDVLVDNTPVDLSKYGMKGQIIPIKGGHTPGDLLVLIEGYLFAGDAFVGTFKAQGGGLVPDGHHVREHFFHENKLLADENLKLIEKIALENGVKTIYPTHNGPVSTAELSKYIKEEPILKLLAAKETNLLNEVLTRKPDLINSTFSSKFILQSVDGNQYDKAQYMEKYITHPKMSMESLSAEDFRIVSANENTVVLTFLEIVKLEGKEAETISITEVYSKEKNDWKLVFKKGTKQ